MPMVFIQHPRFPEFDSLRGCAILKTNVLPSSCFFIIMSISFSVVVLEILDAYRGEHEIVYKLVI